jgi:hypothetical protein
MKERERSLIDSAVRVINQVLDDAQVEERADYSHRLAIEKEARERLAGEHNAEVGALKTKLRDVEERLCVALSSGDLLQQQIDSYLSSHQFLEKYARQTQTGLDELVELVRAIKTTCKSHGDSACSSEVLNKIAAYHEQLHKRVAVERPNIERIDALRDQMNATRAARIEAAKAVKS